ncbi:hypothetical protein BRADI_4g02793v3 [Brachypodium distachyon]|uniref:Reverse transcriptase zinc-binding domain-containing protein n=1 Tax=Brachypodium distachyon TaxID=15368 RepID=A0A2K2CK45_BRADI|nr:hypothetical protein BRADI_4g02793v3 [Brachypodium distachyon]
MVTYHLMAFSIPQGVLKQINKLMRTFIWMKQERPGQAPSSLSLVNWSTVCRPRSLGGLGLPDLAKFGRALRLRWPWFSWADPDRPWIGLSSPCTSTDMDLFRASTRIQLGNGAKTLFWHDPWLPDGGITCARWPRLYAIATRKQRTVQKELQGNNWIRSLQHIATPQELSDFVDLWGLIVGVSLTDATDTISWRWSSSGSYSATSAYKVQFVGSFPPFATAKIWKAHAEPKVRFFAWTVLHGKILTADNLAIRGWPHSPFCSLCQTHLETIAHLCHECSFTAEEWDLIKLWDNDDSPAPTSTVSIDAYWDSLIRGKPPLGGAR